MRMLCKLPSTGYQVRKNEMAVAFPLSILWAVYILSIMHYQMNCDNFDATKIWFHGFLLYRYPPTYSYGIFAEIVASFFQFAPTQLISCYANFRIFFNKYLTFVSFVCTIESHECFLVSLVSVFTQGQFGALGIVDACVCLSNVCPSVYQSQSCPRENSILVQSEITKLRAHVQRNLATVPIVLKGDRPYTSMLNLSAR